jgi:hypothetical protein
MTKKSIQCSLAGLGRMTTLRALNIVGLGRTMALWTRGWCGSSVSQAQERRGVHNVVLVALKTNRKIHKRTDANCSSFHLRLFLGLSNPRDRGRLELYLYCMITLVKEKLSLT